MQTATAKLSGNAAVSLLAILGQNNPAEIESLGLHDDLLLRLVSLRPIERELLIKNAAHFLTLELDIRALERLLNLLDRRRAERDLEDEFLLLGAPLTLMRRLFGMHAAEFSLRRRQLKMAGQGNGRPPCIDEATEYCVWKFWHACRNLDERQRLLKTAELSNQDLSVVWTALKRHELNPIAA
jgi:hypothetical protein